jgi:hypothetical protein
MYVYEGRREAPVALSVTNSAGRGGQAEALCRNRHIPLYSTCRYEQDNVYIVY